MEDEPEFEIEPHILESHLRLAEERLAAYHRDPSGARSAFAIFEELVPGFFSPGQRSEAEWTAEIDRRHEEIERGEVDLLPGPEAIAKLKEEFS